MHNHIFEKYPKNDRSNLIALLQDIQDVYGYLPEDTLREISEYIGIPFSSVYGVATFTISFG